MRSSALPIASPYWWAGGCSRAARRRTSAATPPYARRIWATKSMPVTQPMLEIRGLEAAYGASQVLFGVDLEIRAGETVPLLGRHGMGKATTIRSLLGLTPARAGSVTFLGRRIEREAPDRIARAGIALVPEGR